MATIQIRDVPEEAYEVLRSRARTSGRSIQAYMLEEVVRLASRPSKAEHLAAIEARIARGEVEPMTPAEAVELVHAARR
ncbi:hypothetical protein SAMN06264364_13616 [Quadrisphaera granulorum]|uniref:Antitoxin FitA-like ribbon-helix-helix domain-containing protein n=1 Tax=Quadrisphaera granulorum TaxID=317664 RepID=A0A315ZPM7_9ACTN|nr:antitoxin [Quadrisphaera granulorum]PWJ47585.1 hypothetical protein BXY45_13616 [Quadrisphaera granulorum]SZE98715.1 hypothetical protein SAMN06264364_13616 [Quadrisphaera granulorum]